MRNLTAGFRSMRRTAARLAPWAPALLLGAAAARCFVAVARYANRVPLADDWLALSARALPAGPPFEWLFERHFNHLTVFTKLQVWALHLLGGWDLRAHHLSNQALWTATVVALGVLLRRSLGTPTPVLAAFLLFAFSFKTTFMTLAWVSTCHFALLFSFTATALLFDKRQRDRDLAWGAAAAAAAVYSYGAGLTYVLVLLVFFAGFKAMRATAPGRRRQELTRLACVSLAVSAAVYAWTLPAEFIGRSSWIVSSNDSLAVLFASLTVSGFGWSAPSPVIPGLTLAAACAAAPLLLAARAGSRPPAGVWALGAATAGLLVTMLAMTATHSADENLWQALASIEWHYGAYACLLPALLAAGLHALMRRSAARSATLAALWLSCVAGGLLSGFWSRTWLEAAATANAVCRYHFVELLRERRMPLAGDDLAFAAWIDSARRLDLRFSQELDIAAARPPQATAFGPGATSAGSLGPFFVFSMNALPHLRHGRALGHFIDSAMVTLSPDGGELRVMLRGSTSSPPAAGPALLFVPSTIRSGYGFLNTPLRIPNSLPQRAPQPPELSFRLPPGSQGRNISLYESADLKVGVLAPAGPVYWEEGRGRVLFTYRGTAAIEIGAQTFEGRPGLGVHVPRKTLGPVRITPGPAGFAGVWLEAVGSR